MRVQIKNQPLYGAAHSIALALCTLYTEDSSPDSIIKQYRAQRNRVGAFMKECTTTDPSPDNPIQQRLRELCPKAKRIKLYIQQWGMQGPSHYVLLHRISVESRPGEEVAVFKLGCDRLLSCTNNSGSMIDGILMTWPDSNPEVGCGQQAQVVYTLSASALTDSVLSNLEIQRELRLGVDVMNLYGSPTKYPVWTHPGKTVFSIGEDGIPVLLSIKPYQKTVTKPNVILWGDVTNDSLPDAPELPRHIVPQIKHAEPFASPDALLTRLLRFTLETRLLPYIAVSKTSTRGDIYSLSYEPDREEAFVTCIAENHKCVGLPQVLLIDNEGTEVFVPDLVLAAHLKTLFFNTSAGEDVHKAHVHALRGLFKTMGYTTWEHIQLAFKNWRVTLTSEEETQLEILEAEI